MPANSNDGTETSLRNIVTLLSGGSGEIVSSPNDSTEESLRKVVTLLGSGSGSGANTGLLAGVQWTDRHTTSTGNPYLVGSIVYNAGRVYRCIAENDSILPQQGGNDYWADLGVGYLLPNENPKIKGGSIDTRAGAVTERTYETGDPEDPLGSETSLAGGNSGTITLKGGDGGFASISGEIGGNSGSINLSGYTGNGFDGAGGHGGSITLMGGWDSASAGSINLSGVGGGNHGGSIISTGSRDFSGGTLNMSGGDGAGYNGTGGSINTSDGGGSINTRGTGSIQLGVAGTRTTLNGSASGSNKTITLPNATGTIALTNSFTLAVPNVDIGKTVSSNPLGWTQQVTIPANIAELTGGLPCLLDSVGILITNRLGTGQIHSSSTLTGGIRVGSQSVLTLTPINGVTTYNADNYFSTLQTGVRPWTGNYSKAFSTGGTFGRSLYTGGDLFINNPIVSGIFRTEYWNTTLTEAMDATQTTLLQGLVSGGTAYEGSYLKIDDEVVLITSWTTSGFRPTILRAQLGTTATTHALGSTITTNLGGALGGGILATVYLNFIRVE